MYSIKYSQSVLFYIHKDATVRLNILQRCRLAFVCSCCFKCFCIRILNILILISIFTYVIIDTLSIGYIYSLTLNPTADANITRMNFRTSPNVCFLQKNDLTFEKSPTQGDGKYLYNRILFIISSLTKQVNVIIVIILYKLHILINKDLYFSC